MRVKCWTPNPFKGEFDNKRNTYRHDHGICLFVAEFCEYLERSLNMNGLEVVDVNHFPPQKQPYSEDTRA